MTSKEALSRIKRSHRIAMACLGINKPDIETEEAIKIIEKDLEVLEILKNYSDFYTCRDTYGQSCLYIVIHEDVKNYTIIKEWLEND